MLGDAHVTPRERRVALLEFADPAQMRLRYPCRLRSRTSSIRGRRLAILRLGRWEPGDDESFPDSWSVTSAGEARFDTGPPGNVKARIIDVWVVVTVYAREGDSLVVGGARLGATNMDLRAV